MANTISDALNPIFYAQEAIAALENVLGMGLRVHRGYDAERKAAELGDTIKIPVPSTFTTNALGTGTAQDLGTGEAEIKLTTGREVKFKVTDKQLAWSGQRLIDMHIVPAAYALANYVDASLVALAKDIPWFYDESSSFAYSDFLGARKVLRQNAGTLVDQGDNHFAIDSGMEAGLLGLDVFSKADASGNTAGLIQGSLGQRAGIQPFVNSNLPTHTSGTVVSAGTDNIGALAADADKGATTISIDSLSGAETLAKGDTFKIAGDDQRYVVAADAALATGANAAVSIFPALAMDHASGDVVTFEDGSGTAIHADSYQTNLLFNRAAFAVGFAALPEIGNGAGAQMSSVQDPRNGMSIRSRLAYDDTNAAVVVTLDILFGVRTLDPNKAVVYRRDV